ncbi:MAG: ATP-binding cassette domain-containing protein [Promethearchaeati archaeon SRVP18_Atabeyarchaeia-1]
MAEVAVSMENLTKRFGDIVAVDHISLEIKKGEIFGLLGPNGAGKTTTIRMLCTLLEPTSGTAKVAGYDIRKQPADVRRNIGVVSEGVDLYGDLTARENLVLLGKLFGVPKKTLMKRIDELIDFIGLTGRANDLVSTFSTGMRKKTLIVASLIHNPQLLYLDEVTSGLDPQTAVSVRELTQKLREQGITIIWTTHYLDEPDKICDRVGIIYGGRILALGTPREVKNIASSSATLEFTLNSSPPRECIEYFKKLEGVLAVNATGNTLDLTVHNHEASVSRIIECLTNYRMKITDLAKKEPSLEEAFLKLISDASAKESEGARSVESEVERLRKEIAEAIDKIKSE